MAKRRKANQGNGCAILLVIGLVGMAVKFVVDNAVGFMISGLVILFVAAVAVFMNAGQVQEWWERKQRDARAMERNNPALRLLLVLAYDNGSLSNTETDIIVRYMESVHGFIHTPAFRKDIKRTAPYASERQSLIDGVLTGLEQGEIDFLRAQIRVMKDAHKRRTVEERDRFDDTLWQLGDARPVPHNPYDISPI